MYKSVCNSCKKSQTTKMTCHISPRFGIVSIVKVFVGSNFQLRSRILKFVSPSRSVMTEQQKRDEEKMATDLAYKLALEEKRPPTGFAILADAAL